MSHAESAATSPARARSWTQNVRHTVDATPSNRNRVVDLVRALAIVAVVLGHWLKQGLYVDEAGVLHRAGLLSQAAWTHPLTWLFQVMPLIFLVGGYANGLSWRHASAQGTSYGTWLTHRTRRLTAPLVPLLALWAVAPLVAPSLGLGDDWLHAGSKTSLVATWFIATYLLVVALVPLTHGAWARWGGATIVVGVAAAATVDLLTIGLGVPGIGALNVLLVWGTLHQCGYLWLDRRPRRRTLPAVVACVGLLGCTVLLVWLGPYGVSMVGVEGYGLNNTAPPRLTVLLLGGAQCAAVLALEPWLARVASVRGVWTGVVVVGARAMTIYLWHLTALALVTVLSLHLGGVGLHARTASAEWWAARPGWILVLVPVTALLVGLWGPLERPARNVPARGGAAVPVLVVLVVSACLAFLATYGVGSQSGGVGAVVAAGCLATVVGVTRGSRGQGRASLRAV